MAFQQALDPIQHTVVSDKYKGMSQCTSSSSIQTEYSSLVWCNHTIQLEFHKQSLSLLEYGILTYKICLNTCTGKPQPFTPPPQAILSLGIQRALLPLCHRFTKSYPLVAWVHLLEQVFQEVVTLPWRNITAKPFPFRSLSTDTPNY